MFIRRSKSVEICKKNVDSTLVKHCQNIQLEMFRIVNDFDKAKLGYSQSIIQRRFMLLSQSSMYPVPGSTCTLYTYTKLYAKCDFTILKLYFHHKNHLNRIKIYLDVKSSHQVKNVFASSKLKSYFSFSCSVLNSTSTVFK